MQITVGALWVVAGDGWDEWYHSASSPRTLEGQSSHPAWSPGALLHPKRSAGHTSEYEPAFSWYCIPDLYGFSLSRLSRRAGQWLLATCADLNRFWACWFLVPIIRQFFPGIPRNCCTIAHLGLRWAEEPQQPGEAPASERPESSSAPYLPQISYLDLFI